MPRIAQKELVVNIQLTIPLDKNAPNLETKPYVYDPEWGSECIDPDTGQPVKLYDHVLRSMKINKGYQIWLLIPRYAFEKGGIFRVLPPNLSPNKQYSVDIIQDVLNNAVEGLLNTEVQTSKEEKIREQLESEEADSEYPCERTKWLWILWFYKNIFLIEAVLRSIHSTYDQIHSAGEPSLHNIMPKMDYFHKLRNDHPEEWLQLIIQAAWNSGTPLTPLKEYQNMRDVLHLLTVHPVSHP